MSIRQPSDATDNKTTVGRNRTGMQASPLDGQAMVSGAEEGTPAPQPATEGLAEARRDYAEAGDSLGSVPPPLTARGVATGAVQTLKNQRPGVLLDKLGERLAFERTGSRLYEALLSKVAEGAVPGRGPSRPELEQVRNDELRHLAMVKAAIERLGGDPTVMTPCADVGGVESMGLLQVIADPRTSLLQSLHAILVAELADNDGWELLLFLLKTAAEDELAQGLSQALVEEQEHLRKVRGWIEAMTLAEMQVLPVGGQRAAR